LNFIWIYKDPKK